MSVNETPDEFAFGRNEVENCVCPALAAGMNPENEREYPGLLVAAESYDDFVRSYDLSEEQTNPPKGIVSQSVAKQAWIEMMEIATKNDFSYAHSAIEVAERLGWVEEGEYEV